MTGFLVQVSELSHKLGTAEGNCKSFEEELARLQSQNLQLSKAKAEREVDANDTRAKLHSAEEKVSVRNRVNMLDSRSPCLTGGMWQSKGRMCIAATCLGC